MPLFDIGDCKSSAVYCYFFYAALLYCVYWSAVLINTYLSNSATSFGISSMMRFSFSLVLVVAASPMGMLQQVQAKTILQEACSHSSEVDAVKDPGLLSEECATSSSKIWTRTEQTYSNFIVAGRNLAQYDGADAVEHHENSNIDEPFELFSDFNLADQITGEEGWWDLIDYQRNLDRPSLSFYADKVARKRWLPTVGFEQPKVFVLKYDDEITDAQEKVAKAMAIWKLLPNETSYVAKPSHMSLSDGSWIIGKDVGSGTVWFSRKATKLNEQGGSDVNSQVARSLVKNLNETAHFSAPWATRNAKPGIVVEERFSAHYDEDTPPIEFGMFTIWGRVWIGQYNSIEDQNKWSMGYAHRNGTMVKGSSVNALPDFVDWNRLVEIAERSGAHKDLFRTDIFVGVPAGAVRAGASEEERISAVKYVVNEVAIAPTSTLLDSIYDASRIKQFENALSQEGARLWIAGYQMGNYRVVPNTEVPLEYMETGALREPYDNYR